MMLEESARREMTASILRVLVPVLLAASLVLSAYLAFFVWIQQMGVAGCTSGCDFDLLSTAVTVFVVVDASLLILTFVAAFVLSGRGWAMIIPPITGMALMLIAATIANAWVARALGH